MIELDVVPLAVAKREHPPYVDDRRVPKGNDLSERT